MDIEKIQNELNAIQANSIIGKSDKQLLYYEMLSNNKKGILPISFSKYHSNRITKLSWKQVMEIRNKYKAGIFGKKRLAKEYNISVSMIYKIINNIKWKNIINTNN